MYVNILVILNANELSLMLFFLCCFSVYLLWGIKTKQRKSSPSPSLQGNPSSSANLVFNSRWLFIYLFFFLGKNTQTRCRDFATRPRRSIVYSLFKFNWQSSKGSKLWSQVIFLFIIAVSFVSMILIWLNSFNFPAKRLRKKYGRSNYVSAFFVWKIYMFCKYWLFKILQFSRQKT